ncbi:MAG: hypothetical protein C0625_03825 [Arcobacter sp.]|nr:MAG: hypothetical protein C0625_03825 [Arcobacter sp.]
MEVIKLNLEQYMNSIVDIEDKKSTDFANHAFDWWNENYYWRRFPPLCLTHNNIHLCYLFYTISKNEEYLIINFLLTPKKQRGKGYAYDLLKYLFEFITYKDVNRVKLTCTPSSLPFYNKLGLEYWGVDKLGLYYSDFKMPHQGITGIKKVVLDSSLEEFSTSKIKEMYEMLKLNGKEFDKKQKLIFEDSKEILKEKYHFDDLKNKILFLEKCA